MKRCSIFLLGKCKLKPQWDITSHLLEWLLSKMQEITRTGKDVEKRELSYTVDGNVNWCSHYEWQYEDTSKIMNRTTIWSRYPTLGIYSNNTKTLIWNGICTSMFTAVLFTKSKLQKQYKYPSMNELTRCSVDENIKVHTIWGKKRWWLIKSKHVCLVISLVTAKLSVLCWTSV